MRATPALVVSCGGAAGAAARWGIGETLGATGDNFGWVLLGVNTAGSFLLGFVLCAATGERHETFRLALGPGFCGSFTTFSALAVMTAELGRDGDVAAATAFVVLSVVAAVVAVVIGRSTATRAFRRSAL